MATEEARTLLDALMGGDRNAPLPTGAAVPTRKRQRDDSSLLLLPGQRRKSCFDPDIDPLYMAWGIDIYDLFVNTKSDLGANPNIANDAARQEYLDLPSSERQALGFDYQLFQKLQELVRQCDRTVARNKERLVQEVRRKLSQRGVQDFVEDVDPAAVEDLARLMVEQEDLDEAITKQTDLLKQAVVDEQAAKTKLEPLLLKQKKANELQQSENAGQDVPNSDMKTDDTTGQSNVKEERMEGNDEPTDAGVAVATENVAEETTAIKEDNATEIQIKSEENAAESSTNDDSSSDTLQSLQMDLGRLTLHKQHVLYDLAHLIMRSSSLSETIDTQRRQLNYVRSDISTDKTVCEVSGNFMSSRDADERIAAHYAGKQYIGWKLVRDKLIAMQKQFGRYGPPPPTRGGMAMSRGGPPALVNDRGGSRGNYGGPPPPRMNDRHSSGPPPPRMDDRHGGGGRMDDRHGGGSRGGYGGPPPPRMDHRGPPPMDNRGYDNGGYHDRGRDFRGGGGTGGSWDRGPPPNGRRGPPPSNYRR